MDTIKKCPGTGPGIPVSHDHGPPISSFRAFVLGSKVERRFALRAFDFKVFFPRPRGSPPPRRKLFSRSRHGRRDAVRVDRHARSTMYSQQPQQQRKQPHRAVGAPRLVGMYDADTIIAEPENSAVEPAPPPETQPVDALYHRLLDRFTPVEEPAVAPDVASQDGSAVQGTYDLDRFRKEINLGLKYARVLLRGYPASWRDSNDLKQEVDIAIWKAVVHYKSEMNGAIAYTIAKNQDNKFLGRQVKEQKVAVTTPMLDEAGKSVGKTTIPVLDEFGQQKRVWRQESFDVGKDAKNQDGEPRGMSYIEEKIAMDDLPPIITPPPDKLTEDREKHIRNLPRLRALVDGWYGSKRIVGETLLKYPDATVREFPGVSKSNAGRVLKVVKAEFRTLLQEEVGQD